MNVTAPAPCSRLLYNISEDDFRFLCVLLHGAGHRPDLLTSPRTVTIASSRTRIAAAAADSEVAAPASAAGLPASSFPFAAAPAALTAASAPKTAAAAAVAARAERLRRDSLPPYVVVGISIDGKPRYGVNIKMPGPNRARVSQHACPSPLAPPHSHLTLAARSPTLCSSPRVRPARPRRYASAPRTPLQSLLQQ